MANQRMNHVGIIRIQIKKLDQEIDDCKGVQVQRFYSKRAELKKKIKDLCK